MYEKEEMEKGRRIWQEIVTKFISKTIKRFETLAAVQRTILSHNTNSKSIQRDLLNHSSMSYSQHSPISTDKSILKESIEAYGSDLKTTENYVVSSRR